MLPATADAPAPRVALRRLERRYRRELPALRVELAAARRALEVARTCRRAEVLAGDARRVAAAVEFENGARGRLAAAAADLRAALHALEGLAELIAEASR